MAKNKKKGKGGKSKNQSVKDSQNKVEETPVEETPVEETKSDIPDPETEVDVEDTTDHVVSSEDVEMNEGEGLVEGEVVEIPVEEVRKTNPLNNVLESNVEKGSEIVGDPEEQKITVEYLVCSAGVNNTWDVGSTRELNIHKAKRLIEAKIVKAV